MARTPPNAERNPLRRGVWIIYDSAGFAFRGYRTHPGRYRAYPSHAGQAADSRYFTAPTLTDLAAKVGGSALNVKGL